MALPVLDGNQSATTLSSVVTGGEHIVAHSVVSLGTTAIANITSAVSGAVVTIPALSHLGNSVATDGVADATTNFVKIGGHQSGSNQTAHIVHVSTGGAMSVDATDSVVSISNFPSTQTIAGTVTANAGGDLAGALESVFDVSNVSHKIAVQLYDENGYAAGVPNNPLRIAGTVTVGNSVTIGSLPAISGTVTANVFGKDNTGTPIQLKTDAGGTLIVSASGSVQCVDDSGLIFGSDRDFPISGTVTVGNSVTIGSFATSVTARLVDPTGTAVSYASTGTAGNPSSDVISIQGVSGGTSVPVSISSITIGAVPNGALITRFGSVTTAGTAQISSAVTNASRKYLLVQNVTTSSNVITIGIGFTPTTTQGIQLSAGGGITFESSYIPTGAVYILSSVTASPFTILEA